MIEFTDKQGHRVNLWNVNMVAAVEESEMHMATDGSNTQLPMTRIHLAGSSIMVAHSYDEVTAAIVQAEDMLANPLVDHHADEIDGADDPANAAAGDQGDQGGDSGAQPRADAIVLPKAQGKPAPGKQTQQRPKPRVRS